MCRDNFKFQKETEEGNTISMCICTHLYMCILLGVMNEHNDRNRCSQFAAMSAINTGR